MNENIFYILIQRDRHLKDDYHIQGDYHIERIFELETVVSIIDGGRDDMIIISNDQELLNKYIVVINEDELKMLCNYSEFNSHAIRINKIHFLKFHEEVYSYFIKIKKFEIVSANTKFCTYKVYPNEEDQPWYSIDRHCYVGWVVNKSFVFFKTPARYNFNSNPVKVFSLNDIKVADIVKIEELVNINILNLNNENFPGLKWEVSGEYFKYYDKVSQRRIYITAKLLELLRKHNHITFDIETRLDRLHYIEYYVLGQHNPLKKSIDDFSESYKSHDYSRPDQTDWSNYNDDLDMDQQSDEFWNQF